MKNKRGRGREFSTYSNVVSSAAASKVSGDDNGADYVDPSFSRRYLEWSQKANTSWDIRL